MTATAGRSRAQAPAPAPPAAVFLVGAPRSGTTLLYKSLCLHPEAAWISNWVRRRPGLPQLAVLNRWAPRRPRTRREVWFAGGGNAYVYGERRSLSHRLFPMPVEGEPLFARCGLPGPGGDPAAPDLVALRAAATAIVRASGGRVFVNKRIAHNWRVPLLAAAFPEARFVEIVRDGRAVAYSLSRVDWWEDCDLGWTTGTPRQWRAAGGDPWELCARHWTAELDVLAGGLAGVAPERRLRLSYEDFVAAPVDTLGRVAAFVGLGPDAGWHRSLGELGFPDRRETWREKLDREVVARIEAVQQTHLEANGYVLG